MFKCTFENNFSFNKRSFLYCVVLILILNISYISSDLPVHCKREQIEGLWTFRIEKYSFNADLNIARTSCGHGFPDKIEKTVGDNNFSFLSFYDIEVTLASDYKIYDSIKKEIGHWTPVYDEAFVAYVKRENGKTSVFTSFLKYYKQTPSDQKYQSNCDKTMIGWYQPDEKENNKNWSCFFGFKSKIKSQFESRSSFLQKMPESKNSEVLESSNFIEMKVETISKENMSLHSILYNQNEIVNELNSSNLPWKASIHEEFKNLSFFELKEKLGLKRSKYRKDSFNFYDYQGFENNNQPNMLQNKEELEIDDFLESMDTLNSNKNKSMNKMMDEEEVVKTPDKEIKESIKTEYEVEADGQFVSDYNVISKYIDKELNEIDINKLPKNWDWRNVGGVNYVPKPRKQMNCGSCYIFSLVESLEARLRILTNNKDQTEFSRQFPLACSFYTEGCQGGYPFLVAKFFSEFEVIPESCAPYDPDNVNCNNICDYKQNPTKYFVSKYEYLGGFYGATNEIELIKEIRARGPIPGNMSVPWTFSYYKNGIFSQNSLKRNSGSLSKTTLFDRNISWSNVDHSILLVGYGEENGTKYWIGMNTWGNQWGENGFFRILRGENDCNIETMGDAARISFKKR